MEQTRTLEVIGQSWYPLKITHGLANKVEDIDANIESAIQRKDVTWYQDLVGKERGAVAIVGSGPSLKKLWKKIPKGMDILACNAACQFLLGKGIVPKYMMCFDADPLMLEFVTAPTHKETTYLLASRCPPEAFDLLEGHKVVCWHAAGDPNVEKILQKHGRFQDPMVIGGTAAVTRSLILAQTLGYTEVHLFGADGSFYEGDTHIRQSTTVERKMTVRLGARNFETAPWMTQQVEDFKLLAPPLRDRYGVRFVVHGDGLIPHLARVMGFEVEGEPKYKHALRHLKYNAQQLWATL